MHRSLAGAKISLRMGGAADVSAHSCEAGSSCLVVVWIDKHVRAMVRSTGQCLVGSKQATTVRDTAKSVSAGQSLQCR